MTVADDILAEIKRKPGLTEADLAALLFGRRNGYQQRVNSTCRRLIAKGLIQRQGNGGPSDPYTYRKTPLPRRV